MFIISKLKILFHSKLICILSSDGYDKITHKCSPDIKGKSISCPGENAVCELIKETYVGVSFLAGDEYFLRKCGTKSNASNMAGCDPPKIIGSTKITKCFCNTKDNCNEGQVAGVGEKKISN